MSTFFLSAADLEIAIDSVIVAVAPFNQGQVSGEAQIAPRIHIGTPFWRRVRNARAKDDVVHRAYVEAVRRGYVVSGVPGLNLSEPGWDRWRRIHGVKR